jgi:hypothetical protein
MNSLNEKVMKVLSTNVIRKQFSSKQLKRFESVALKCLPLKNYTYLNWPQNILRSSGGFSTRLYLKQKTQLTKL